MLAAHAKEPRSSNPEIQTGQHMIGRFEGDPSGPLFLAFGSVHGNEAAGAIALKRVADRLPAMHVPLRGRVVLFAGNTRAIKEGVRFVDSDLNRHWTDEIMDRIARTGPELAEDHEQTELLAEIESLLSDAKNEVYALDLHSTSAAGVPFATVGDTMRNRRFSFGFPVTILLGIEEQLDGTLLEYLNNRGAVTMGFEGGQHTAASTIDSHEALVWLGLVNAGVMNSRDVPDLEHWRSVLKGTKTGPGIVEVRYRYAITAEDDFRMEPGFENFEPIREGQLLARDRRGEILAKETGLMLMPLYQKLGEDGFFIGREVAGFWLWLSGVLRRARVGSLMHWLPGVRRSSTDPDTFEIDTSVARFFPLQIFHLLGFRKRRWRANMLVVSRRRYDTSGPFSEA